MELLRYRIYSEDGTISFKRPVMVLVHGLGGGYANWLCQVRHLKQHYDLLLVELPSHGRSKLKISQFEPNFDTVTSLIFNVMDHLGIQKASFVGVSLGTLIVKHIIVHYPERVDKYFMVGPVGKFTPWLKAAIWLVRLLLPILPLNTVLRLIVLIVVPYKQLSYGRDLFLGCAPRVGRKEFGVWCKVLQSFDKTQNLYEKTMLEEPNGLYIIGAMDHFFFPMLKPYLPRIKHLAVVENAGHICCVDQYETVNRLIIQFQETGTITS